MTNPEIPRFNPDNPGPYLDALFNWTVSHVQGQINWYSEKRGPKRWGSQAVRAITVLLLTAGALCPMLDAIDVTGWPKFSPWGYVLLAIGGGVFSYDSYFGLSSGWIRYSLTGMTLEKLLVQFRFDWALAEARQTSVKPSPEDLMRKVQLARDFALQVHEQVKQESDAWALEFKSSIAEMQKALGTGRDAAKPGALKISLANGKSYQGVELSLNDKAVQTLDGVAEALIDHVAPGRYTVAVAALKNGATVRDAKVVEVTPGLVVTVALSLPA
jgi:hypothetical protein